jgi:hypothetical protein
MRYSLEDECDFSPDIDALTCERGALDSHGYDCDDFARAVSDDSLDFYLDSLALDIDARGQQESFGASPDTYVRLLAESRASSQRVADRERALTLAAIDALDARAHRRAFAETQYRRYISRFGHAS